MTVQELVSALAKERPEARIDVRVEGQPDGDWAIEDIATLSIPVGPNAGHWVTLILEGAS
jgi:hypothetical protein